MSDLKQVALRLQPYEREMVRVLAEERGQTQATILRQALATGFARLVLETTSHRTGGS